MVEYVVTLNPTISDNGPQYVVTAPTAVAAYGRVRRGLGLSDTVHSIELQTDGSTYWIRGGMGGTARVAPTAIEEPIPEDLSTIHRYI